MSSKSISVTWLFCDHEVIGIWTCMWLRGQWSNPVKCSDNQASLVIAYRHCPSLCPSCCELVGNGLLTFVSSVGPTHIECRVKCTAFSILLSPQLCHRFQMSVELQLVRVIPDSPACLHWDAHLGCFFCTFLHSLKISFCLSQPSAFQLCKSNSGSSMSLWVHMTNSYSSWVRITELGFIGSDAADWCCHLPLRKAILDCPWTKWDQRIPWFSFSAKLLPYLDAESS